MKQKLIACGLSLTLLFAQNVFVYSQTVNIADPNDTVINLYDDPDLIAVVQVKKILTETAPMLLSGSSGTMEKVKAAMNDIENEMGVDPFALDKIYFGMNLGKAEDSTMFVLKTNSSANTVIEKIYAAQVGRSKFAAEINPLKNRIDSLERGIKPLAQTVIPQSLSGETDVQKLDDFQTDLEKFKPTKAETAAYTKLKTDTAELKRVFAEYQILSKSVYDLGDLSARLEAIKKQVDGISSVDPQKAAKIAAAGKLLGLLEKEYKNKRLRMFAADEAKAFAAFSMDGFPSIPERIAGDDSANQSEVNLEKLQSAVSERIENLKSLNETMSQKDIAPNAFLTRMEEEATKYAAFPISETTTRKDEMLREKKLLVMTTVKKFLENGEPVLKPVENLFLAFDEQTVIIGNRPALTKTIEPKTAETNRLVKNMIARSPAALVSFGVNFRNQDMSSLTEVFGEQKNAWQIIGSLDSGGSDISLTTLFEKSEFPALVQKKKSDGNILPETPDIPGKDEIKELVESMFKSMNGIEAKVTVRFDKQKTATFIEKSPRFLNSILKR